MIDKKVLNKIDINDQLLSKQLPNYATSCKYIDNKFVVLYFGLRKRGYTFADLPKKPTSKFLSMLADNFIVGHTYKVIDYHESTRNLKTVKIYVTNIYDKKSNE